MELAAKKSCKLWSTNTRRITDDSKHDGQRRQERLYQQVMQVIYKVPRASFYYEPTRSVTAMDESLTKRIWRIIQEFLSYGLRRIHAVLRNRLGLQVNSKKVHRIIKLNGWQKNSKSKCLRPRVKGKRHLTTRPNQLWAIDTTSIFCGLDGWWYMTAVIDCFEREIVGWRQSAQGKASDLLLPMHLRKACGLVNASAARSNITFI